LRSHDADSIVLEVFGEASGSVDLAERPFDDQTKGGAGKTTLARLILGRSALGVPFLRLPKRSPFTARGMRIGESATRSRCILTLRKNCAASRTGSKSATRTRWFRTRHSRDTLTAAGPRSERIFSATPCKRRSKIGIPGIVAQSVRRPIRSATAAASWLRKDEAIRRG
jgi:hypothetical protein